MPIIDHNQPKIMKVILNFPFFNKTDYWLLILPLAKKMIENQNGRKLKIGFYHHEVKS